MDDRETFKTEPIGKKNELLGKAVDLAYLLTKGAGIEKVGIAGSLARGKENPSDLDFVIFLPLKKVLEHRIDATLGIEVPWHERLDLNESVRDSLKIILDVFKLHGIKLDVHFLPESFDEKIFKTMFDLSGDPSYMLNIVRDILIFDSSSEKFERKPVYSPDQIDQIRLMSFEKLKSIVNDEQALDQIYQHPGSQKRRTGSAVQQVIDKFKNRDPN